jgi:peptide/nickel transport system ATP-binding protein
VPGRGGLHQGRIVERGTPEQLFTAPQHPYTRQLVQARPRLPPAARARRQARAADSSAA